MNFFITILHNTSYFIHRKMLNYKNAQANWPIAYWIGRLSRTVCTYVHHQSHFIKLYNLSSVLIESFNKVIDLLSLPNIW